MKRKHDFVYNEGDFTVLPTSEFSLEFSPFFSILKLAYHKRIRLNNAQQHYALTVRGDSYPSSLAHLASGSADWVIRIKNR